MLSNSELITLTAEHDRYLNAQRNHTSKDKERILKSNSRSYKAIQKHLPVACTSILDIGCGLGIMDLCLFEHYGRNKGIHFNLFDKTEYPEQIHFGYKKTASFYNDLDLSKKVLVDYGILESKISTINATADNLRKIENVDLIISCIAWGFHFPVSTYIQEVYDLMNEKSVLILDIRDDTGGLEELSKLFDVEIIEQENITVRVCCKKPSVN
jgi:SAM-dependent methyltransferase